MTRIFASLAIANLSLIFLTGLMALIDNASSPDRHILLAVCTLLLSCFLQVLGFTYLTVTGKVIAQAAHLASLNSESLEGSKRLKQAFTRLLAIAVAGIVLTAATGGAAWRSSAARPVHILAALFAAVIHVFVYHRQYRVVRSNALQVEATLKAYANGRAGRADRIPPVPADPENMEQAN